MGNGREDPHQDQWNSEKTNIFIPIPLQHNLLKWWHITRYIHDSSFTSKKQFGVLTDNSLWLSYFLLTFNDNFSFRQSHYSDVLMIGCKAIVATITY